MVSWLTETMRPLMLAGDISAMYMGDSIDAMPTPRPPMMRKNTNQNSWCERPTPIAEMPNRKADNISPGFLPYRSEIDPAIRHPAIQPRYRLLTAKPLPHSLRWKYGVMNGSAPEITEISKPNNSPPRAEITDMVRM